MPVKKKTTLDIDVYDVKGKAVGKVSLPKAVFAAKVNPRLLAQAVRVYLANQRVGTASTKTRGEVQKSTKKIWKQKHTGRARHGAKSAPLFVGGGIAFGPKPRDYSLKIPKKMKKRALASAFSLKLKEKAIKVITGLDKIVPKTKTMKKIVEKGKKTLLVVNKKKDNIYKAARNIAGLTIRPIDTLNTYEILTNNQLLLTKEAINKLEEQHGTN
ncbi:50S ribosomal protein L4 [Candidatus Microgenomates bacterium]|nr:50S ribosomal protein L4 [Candidatus Microgenomates bacterium]